MPQWDARDTSPHQWVQNVLETFEIAIRHNRRTRRTELERVFCRWIYFHLRSKIFSWLSWGQDDRPNRPPPTMDPPLGHRLRTTPCLSRFLFNSGKFCGRHRTNSIEYS